MAQNGMLDPATLVDVTGNGDYLTTGAARDFIALRDAIWDRYRVALGVTELYRDRAAQDYVWSLYYAGDPRVPYPPAPKYTSNHGWAEAADVSGYSIVPSFDQILAEFGWVRDVANEPWHLHHVAQITPAGGETRIFRQGQQTGVPMFALVADNDTSHWVAVGITGKAKYLSSDENDAMQKLQAWMLGRVSDPNDNSKGIRFNKALFEKCGRILAEING